MNSVVERVAFHDSARGGGERRRGECSVWLWRGFGC